MSTIKLLNKREITESLYELTYTKPTDYTYKCGQFARLGLEINGEMVFRAYSIASHPSEETLTFVITKVLEGKLSHRLCEMPVGEEVTIEGQGEGNLLASRIPGGKTLWLICTGSGISPFLSLLKDKATWDAWQDIVLVQGCRYLADGQLAKDAINMDLPGALTTVVATTREESIQGSHISGRIPELIKTGTLESHVGKTLDPSDSRVLLCGNPNFIEQARAILKEKGFVSPRMGNPGNLLAETFW